MSPTKAFSACGHDSCGCPDRVTRYAGRCCCCKGGPQTAGTTPAGTIRRINGIPDGCTQVDGMRSGPTGCSHHNSPPGGRGCRSARARCKWHSRHGNVFSSNGCNAHRSEVKKGTRRRYQACVPGREPLSQKALADAAPELSES